ncbi:MAG: hypothetical protein KIS86_00485 [Devosia sp.]|nr:hypothetical protein [Devosia sp.]
MNTFFEQHSGPSRPADGFIARTLARLPRIVGVTALAMAASFLALQLLPTQYRARLDIALAPDNAPEMAIEQILSPLQLADIVSRLPNQTVLDLRRSGGGTLDSTALLRRQLTLAPAPEGTHLRLEAIASAPDHAGAIVNAVAASYTNDTQTLPEPLPVSAAAPPQSEPARLAVVEPSVARIGADPRLLQQRLTLAWENRVRLEDKAERIDALVAAGNFTALALQAEGLPGLGRRIDDLAALEAEHEKLAVTLLANHPAMRTLSEQIALASAEISREAVQLAATVRADSEAALRLEAGLRAEYDAQMASIAIDNTVLTGSIGVSPVPEVSALPRPVGAAWALALSGGLTFFGQLGLIAWRQPRRIHPLDDLFGAQDPDFGQPMDMAPPPHRPAPIPEPVPLPTVPAAVPAPTAAPAHNWFGATSAPPEVAVKAQWVDAATIVQTTQTEPPAKPRAAPAPAPRQPDPLDGLDSARIVAIRSTGSLTDTRAWARDLLEAYAQEGRRVVMIDAASRRRGAAPGISDLSMGQARFADIVHGTGRNEAALIPWGRQDTLYASARQVRTLLLALVELYDVVVITLAAEADGSSHLADMADIVLAATPRAATPRRKERAAAWR